MTSSKIFDSFQPEPTVFAKALRFAMLRQALPLARQAARRPIGLEYWTQWPGTRLDQSVVKVELL